MSNLGKTNPSTRSIGRNLLFSLVYSAVVPYLIYRVCTIHFHLSVLNALLLSGISPVVGLIADFVRKRRVSVIALLAIIGIVVKVLSAWLFHDPRLVMISDSLLSGVFGLLLLGSVLIGKPVLVVIATSMHAKTPIERERMKRSLQAPGFHRHLMILTEIWGIGLLLIMLLSIVLAYTLPISSAILFRPVIDRVMIGVVVASTLLYRWYVRRGHSRQ